MRVTKDVKRATRREILAAAKRLFRHQGFASATTRDIARTAGIAAGTVFNYFASKDEIALTLMNERLARAEAEFQQHRRAEASLEEDLFAHIAVALRKMRPLRKFLRPVVESTLGPAGADNAIAESLRRDHLQIVERLVGEHGISEFPTALALQLYWMLYVGVLAHWCDDSSPHQEDTLALLDQSLNMFVNWLQTNPSGGNGR